jgi:hypothetical protein
MNSIQAESFLLDSKGYATVPLVPRDKRPTAIDWPTRRFNCNDFKPDSNIGIILGKRSAGLVDVDLDDPVALQLADEYLPPTEAVMGRPSAPRSHRWYICPEVKYRKWTIPECGTILELRSDGHQTVVGPSIHPSGEQYEKLRGNPAEIDAATLTAVCEKLYQAVCKHYGVESTIKPDSTKQSVPWERPVPQSTPEQSISQPASNTSGASVGQSGADIEKRAIAYLNKCPPAISGQGGHPQTFEVTQALIHGFLLSDETAFRLLMQHYNPRCQPPWSEKEIRHKVEEAIKKPCNKQPGWLLNDPAYAPLDPAKFSSVIDVGSLIAKSLPKQVETNARQIEASMKMKVVAVSASEYLRRPPPSITPIFPGLIDRGDKIFVVGQSKSYKSFFALQMSLCLASGRPFLNWKSSRPLKVLMIQFELKEAKYHGRVQYVANTLGIKPEDISDRLKILNLRGKPFLLDNLQVDDYDLIVFDPWYKLLDRKGLDESRAADMAVILGKIDEITERGPAILIVHHGTKGRIGDKQAIDRASGSGLLGRDADSHFTLTPHRDHSGEWLVLETILRYYRSPDAVTIEFRNGIFIIRTDVPPLVETSQTANRAKQAGPSIEELSVIVKGWITGSARTADIIDRIRREFSVGEKKADAVIRQLEGEGFTRSKTKSYPAYGIITPSDSQNSISYTPPIQRELNGIG